MEIAAVDELDREIDRNYDWFRRSVAGFLPDHAGEFAIVRAAQLVAFSANVREAAQLARERFPDGLYSIQPVIEEPADLGFFSHAGD